MIINNISIISKYNIIKDKTYIYRTKRAMLKNIILENDIKYF